MWGCPEIGVGPWLSGTGRDWSAGLPGCAAAPAASGVRCGIHASGVEHSRTGLMWTATSCRVSTRNRAQFPADSARRLTRHDPTHGPSLHQIVAYWQGRWQSRDGLVKPRLAFRSTGASQGGLRLAKPQRRRASAPGRHVASPGGDVLRGDSPQARSEAGADVRGRAAENTTGCYTNVFNEGDRWISLVVEPRS